MAILRHFSLSVELLKQLVNFNKKWLIGIYILIAPDLEINLKRIDIFTI